jgi:small neutral amino acid transporter SnatA (MarC family)
MASLVLLFALLIADRLTKHLPARTMRIITRFMGLIILTVGAQFILAGFYGYRPS